MASNSFQAPSPQLLRREDFPQLLHTLKQLGYQIVGPVLSQGAIQWKPITTPEDFPMGWKDQQEPGSYRLEPDPSPRYFNIVHGPESLKPLTFAPRETLLVLDYQDRTFSAKEIQPDTTPTAVLGVRACDLAGLDIQDRIFLHDTDPDPYYQQRRDNLLLIAVNCTRAHSTCFCASMETGPKAQHGFDVCLTEADEDF
ncbi:MAG: sulfite reductase subunit A, partial [Nitrospirota bacterium]|nr:sulfite reductase subunit A [Nitrospirota bacterium]